MSDISRNIIKYREDAGLTRNELAEKMCVTSQTIWNYEKGHKKPTPERLSELADIFGVSRQRFIYYIYDDVSAKCHFIFICKNITI